MELTERETKILLNAIISSFVTNFRLSEIATTRLNRRKLKSSVNNALRELKMAEKTYDVIESQIEKEITDVSNYFYNFLEVVAKVPMEKTDEARGVLEAYLNENQKKQSHDK